MRHKVEGNKLGRLQSERKALLRNLAVSLIKHGRIRTTRAKARALRPFVEPLVTRAKVDNLSNRRVIAARLPYPTIVKKLFTEIGPRYADRKGGYLRIVKVSGFRRGDATVLAEVQWV